MSLQIKASALFPLGGVDWPRKLLIGGATGLLLELVFVGLAYLASEEAAFGIAPLAVLVNLPAIGYVVRAYEGALRRDAVDLPEWEGWPGLFSGGADCAEAACRAALAPRAVLRRNVRRSDPLSRGIANTLFPMPADCCELR